MQGVLPLPPPSLFPTRTLAEGSTGGEYPSGGAKGGMVLLPVSARGGVFLG